MRKTVAAFFCMIVFACLVFQSFVSAEVSWDIQVVSEDAEVIGSGYCPIKVDSKGNPHIVYSGFGYMGYVSWNGSEWNNQKGSYGVPHDLVLDANDTPHITLGSLEYATWNGTQWNLQQIDTGYIPYSSLALDSSGNAHIAYINDGEKLKYATQSGSNWTTQTVDTDANLPDTEPTFSLALDSNDTPHIMYYSLSSFVDEKGNTIHSINLKQAVLQNSSWTIEPVPTSPNLVAFGNMVLDSAGNPHFLAKQQFYPEGSDTRRFTVEYFRWDGSTWKTQTVTSNVSLNQLGLLALDSEDRPHIIYISWWPEQLMYARWTGIEWKTYHVDEYGQLAPSHGFNFALDTKDNPHISYIRAPGNSSYWIRQLKYATATLPPLPKPLNVSIVSPENTTYTTNEIPLTFTTSKQASSISYSLDGEANVTITGNTTITDLPNGTHNLTIYATDETDNTKATETIYFTITKEDTFPDSTILLVSAAIITATAIIIIVYVWKKRH
jgi:hypothetical protein